MGHLAAGDLGAGGFTATAVSIDHFDAVLARTMPAGSLEKITFRLSILHAFTRDRAASHRPVAVINSPRGLEIAIDKFATLAHVRRLGYRVPETIVVQSRPEAIAAFERLGGDCVVKPLFGGEGRGVMRIQDPQLAWYTFSTLQQLDAVFYIQAFVPPGGRDTRLLVIGDHVIAARRENLGDFRTNHSHGATTTRIEPSSQQIAMAKQITATMGLTFASVDLIDCDDGEPRVLEVNAVPGWKGLQQVCSENIATLVMQTLMDACKDAPTESTTESNIKRNLPTPAPHEATS
ncbi:alpha-L-glutamate ligase, RimK family [Rhodopirellula maiorica SM1]|uniref:Alpha-L-glutamate ligase, RimK family n=1 Tax=Rhodopirellula maiorica SM1 TaxID=1265738 RepID=M5R7B3_9BACT|nr:alpha-L-glutamate ligase, RimK family [Rhodopirellula maiorica SM1]